MVTIPIHDRNGHEVGTYEVDPAEFAPKINRQLMHDAVVMYQANLRQGTHKSKTRGEVHGTTKKLYRQKGTGNARAGSRRSGVRRGGGHIFALQNRDYSYRLPRKAVQLATRMAIASKIRDGQVVIIDELSFDVPKTKEMTTILKKLGCSGLSLLVATAAYDENVYKSSRNISQVNVSPSAEINALHVLAARKMLATKQAMDLLKERAKKMKTIPNSPSSR
ncbi:MAG: 50S ribosomal protein L4 [Pirellulales bacterium]|nr:50S ribosomal protein L4 [Pirellulales bacterium]